MRRWLKFSAKGLFSMSIHQWPLFFRNFKILYFRYKVWNQPICPENVLNHACSRWIILIIYFKIVWLGWNTFGTAKSWTTWFTRQFTFVIFWSQTAFPGPNQSLFKSSHLIGQFNFRLRRTHITWYQCKSIERTSGEHFRKMRRTQKFKCGRYLSSENSKNSKFSFAKWSQS